MKKKLLIGLSVAVLGTVATTGTALALYKNTPSNITINIGARTNKDLVYTIKNLAWDSPAVLKPSEAPILSFTIGADKTLDSTYTQNVMVGRLTVEVSSTNSDFIDYYANQFYLKVKDYKENSFYTKDARYRCGATKNDGKIVMTKEFPVKLAGQKVEFLLPTPIDISKEDMLKVAGAAFTVDIKWEEATSFKYAYVANSLTDPAFGELEEYQMVPNLATENFEWMYQMDSAHQAAFVEGTEYKCRKTENDTTTWSGPSEGNMTVSAAQAGKLTGIYWTGASGDVPTYSTAE